MPSTIQEKEKRILSELKKQNVRVSHSLVKIDAKTRAWEHRIGNFEDTTKEDIDKLWEIVSKHFKEWLESIS
ncbi:MAG: hypothetical protein ABSB89_09445 [Candidatus Bathyarchaeia archaeon]